MKVSYVSLCLLWVVTLLSSCSWWSDGSKGGEGVSAPTTLDCSKLSDEKERKTCEDTENARKTAEADATNLATALEKRDVSLCEKLSEKERARACVDSVTLQKASESGDPSLCEKLEWPRKKDCEKDINKHLAEKTGDTAYCEKIEQEVFRESCLSTVRDWRASGRYGTGSVSESASTASGSSVRPANTPRTGNASTSRNSTATGADSVED